MSRYNTPRAHSVARSPFVTETVPSGRTYEGAPGYARDAKTELFLLAVSYFGHDAFYETADAQTSRLRTLVRKVAVEDPAWVRGFIGWLRDTANMRTAAVVAGAEAAYALRGAGKPGGRQIVDAALQRAEEPGELLAYWHTRYGRSVPIAVKRGIGDAVLRMWGEFQLLKYDTASHGFRFADVLAIVHAGDRGASSQGARFRGAWQHDLFAHAIGRRYGRDTAPESLAMVRANKRLRALAGESPAALLDTDALRAAGMTWEDALSLAGSKVAKKDLWEALIPVMSYMGLLRNLRNFDEAGVSDTAAAMVAARLADPVQVAKSRQLPMRFLSAHRAVPSLRWAWPLEQALTASIGNVPALPGRTLILVDTSTSMNNPFSDDGTLRRWDAAVLFGVALGQRCATADVVSFSSAQYYYSDPPGVKTKVFPLQPAESLLRALDRWRGGGWFLGGGTATALAVQAHYSGHNRVVIVTDDQASEDGPEVSRAVPASVPLYTWNLVGYERGHGPSGSAYRHTFGGLTDAAFGMVSMLEAGRDATWPWMQRQAAA